MAQYIRDMWLEMIGIRVMTVSTDTVQVDTRCDALGKISSKRNKLENYRKNEYHRYSYSLYDGQLALISPSASRDVETKLYTTVSEARIFVAALARAAKSRRQ